MTGCTGGDGHEGGWRSGREEGTSTVSKFGDVGRDSNKASVAVVVEVQGTGEDAQGRVIFEPE
jgi:hypothetical protein